jgi:hypothetical protein
MLPVTNSLGCEAILPNVGHMRNREHGPSVPRRGRCAKTTPFFLFLRPLSRLYGDDVERAHNDFYGFAVARFKDRF